MYHNESDSQHLVDENQDAFLVQKRQEHQKNADQRRVVPQKLARAVSDKEVQAEVKKEERRGEERRGEEERWMNF